MKEVPHQLLLRAKLLLFIYLFVVFNANLAIMLLKYCQTMWDCMGVSQLTYFFSYIVFDFTGSCQARHYIFRRRPTKEILFLHERHATIRPCHCHGNIIRGWNSFLLYIRINKFHSMMGKKNSRNFD